MQAFVTMCLNIVLTDDSGIDMGSDHSVAYKVDGAGTGRTSAPPKFCSSVIKLTALQMHSLGVVRLSTF